MPFYSMTGEKVGSDYFKHSNMVPILVVKQELLILDPTLTKVF